MRGKEILDSIKCDIEEHIGEKVLLKANSGRHKMIVREGILEKTYTSIFVVKVEDNESNIRMLSYSYSDILTQTVQLVYKADNLAI